MGSGRSRARRAARRRQTPGRRHQVDDRPRQCLPRAAERCDGRRAAHAKEGLRCGKPEDHRAAEGHDSGCPDQGSHRDPASQSAGDLRPGLQPRRRLRPSDLSLSAYLLPARGLLRCRCRDRVRRGRRDGRVLGRRLGLRPAMGLRQRPHQREQPVCEPLQPLQQLQPVRRQLESQSGRIAAVRRTRIATPRTAMAARRGAIRWRRDRRRPGRIRARRRGHSLPPAPIGAGAPVRIVPARRPVRAARARTAARRARAAATASAIAASRAAKVTPAEAATPSAAPRAAARAAAPPAAAASAGRPAWARRAHAPVAAAGDGGNRP